MALESLLQRSHVLRSYCRCYPRHEYPLSGNWGTAPEEDSSVGRSAEARNYPIVAFADLDILVDWKLEIALHMSQLGIPEEAGFDSKSVQLLDD